MTNLGPKSREDTWMKKRNNFHGCMVWNITKWWISNFIEKWLSWIFKYIFKYPSFYTNLGFPCHTKCNGYATLIYDEHFGLKLININVMLHIAEYIKNSIIIIFHFEKQYKILDCFYKKLPKIDKHTLQGFAIRMCYYIPF